MPTIKPPTPRPLDNGAAPLSDAPAAPEHGGAVLPALSASIIVVQCVLDQAALALASDAAQAKWTGFLSKADRIVRRLRGHMGLSVADGFQAHFTSVRQACTAASELHTAAAKTRTPDPLQLRIGLHATAQAAVEGASLATSMSALLAIHLAGLAEAGETVCSATVRDLLTEGLDVAVHDLGECHLKHVPQPVRAYRLTGASDPMPADAHDEAAVPALAVIPFCAKSADPDFFVVGELVADRVIAQLGRSKHVRVISRLTGTAFRDRNHDPATIREHLRARYVLSGQYRLVGKSLNGLLGVTVELTDTTTEQVIWSASLRGSVGDLLSQESELAHAVATGAHHAILDAQVSAMAVQPIRSLNHYALMLGGISLMHRSAPDQFGVSRQALEELLRRDPDLHAARAWLAKWYVLRVTRGLTATPQNDATAALQQARLSQASADVAGLGLAMEGFVHLHLLREFDRALQLIQRASTDHPSEPLAWLFGGVAHSFLNQPDAAQNASRRALSLSPMDPLLYYFESLAATSAIVAHRYEEAITLCKRSLRRNVTHLHTHRALVTACWAAGKPLQARQAAGQLLRLAPGYTVAAYEKASASTRTELGRLMSHALREAGIPPH